MFTILIITHLLYLPNPPKMSENGNYEKLLFVGNVKEILISPPRRNWSKIAEHINEYGRGWLEINTRGAHKGKIRLTELCGKKVDCMVCDRKLNNERTINGYLFYIDSPGNIKDKLNKKQ